MGPAARSLSRRTRAPPSPVLSCRPAIPRRPQAPSSLPRPSPAPSLPGGLPPPASHHGSEENPQGKAPEVGCRGSGRGDGPAEPSAACTCQPSRLGRACGAPIPGRAAGAGPAGRPSHPTPSDGVRGGPGAQSLRLGRRCSRPPRIPPRPPSQARVVLKSQGLGPSWYCRAEGHCPARPGWGVGGEAGR